MTEAGATVVVPIYPLALASTAATTVPVAADAHRRVRIRDSNAVHINDGRIALAEPQTVPAGIYAKEYLQKTDLWKKIIDKVVPTENVRACLAAVESGNADASAAASNAGPEISCTRM